MSVLLSVGALFAWVVLMDARREALSWELMPVVEALERHQSDHGHYPEKLADLMPDYLPEAPPTELSYTLNLETAYRGRRGLTGRAQSRQAR